MTATVSVVLTFWPAMAAPTIQVSHSSVSLESRLVMPVRLNRPARLVPGPEKPGRVLLVVEVSTTRPGMRSSWPVANKPGNGGMLLCPAGPVSCRPVKPAWCRFMPRKSTSMSTNQPNPLAPALAPRSGANTSIRTGLARCEAPAGLADDVLALTADVTAAVAPTTTAAAAAATIRLFFMGHVLPWPSGLRGWGQLTELLLARLCDQAVAGGVRVGVRTGQRGAQCQVHWLSTPSAPPSCGPVPGVSSGRRTRRGGHNRPNPHYHPLGETSTAHDSFGHLALRVPPSAPPKHQVTDLTLHPGKAPAPALLDDPGVKPIRTGRARTPGQQGGHRPGPITSETVIGTVICRSRGTCHSFHGA